MSSRIYSMGRAVYWCAGGLLLINSLPHALPLTIRKSQELPGSVVPQELVSHVHKIAAAMGLPHSDNIKVFITSGFSSVCGGHTSLPLGAVIGLPRTVLFKGADDVIRSEVFLEGQPVDWESDIGQLLLHLLPPSTGQINFRIAHEVGHLQHKDLLPRILLSPTLLLIGYHFASSMCKHVVPVKYVAPAFPLLFAMTLVAYAQINSAISHWQEYNADKAAAISHPSYAEGGIELMTTHGKLDTLLRRRPSKFSLESFTQSLNSHPPFHKRQQRLEELCNNIDSTRNSE